MQNDNLNDLAKSFALKPLPDSEVELSGEIPAQTIAPYRERALVHLAEHVDMPGFRPGHVPADLVLKKVGEVSALEEAVELFMQDFYMVLIEAHKVDAVGRPDIRITKLAPGNPIGVVINASVYPIVTLPKNWKSISEHIAVEPAAAATDEDVEKTLESIRQSRKQGDAVPELTDEFAKTLGAFENVDSLKTQIKKGITEEKERAARDTRRGKIIDALLEKVEVAIPAIFVESELDKIMAQMKEDISRFNIPFEDYLKRVEKTEEQLRSEFRDQAKKRAKLQLVLNKITEEEKIEADKEVVEQEIKHALEHFPDAKSELVKIHVETVLRNEKALQLLESGGKKE
jgi:FKBP-type peptidyl-prolyl cis-trans isomerase (trigger factor)